MSPLSKTDADGTLNVRIGTGTGQKGVVQVLVPGVADTHFVIESAFSYPYGGGGVPESYRNPLSHLSYNAEGAWSPTVTQLSATSAKIEAEGAYYEVARTITLATSGRIEVTDVFTNKSATTPVGILTENAIVTQDAFSVTRQGLSSCEPIFFGAQPDYDVGVLVGDRISRVAIRLLLGRQCAPVPDESFRARRLRKPDPAVRRVSHCGGRAGSGRSAQFRQYGPRGPERQRNTGGPHGVPGLHGRHHRRSGRASELLQAQGHEGRHAWRRGSTTIQAGAERRAHARRVQAIRAGRSGSHQVRGRLGEGHRLHRDGLGDH